MIADGRVRPIVHADRSAGAGTPAADARVSTGAGSRHGVGHPATVRLGRHDPVGT